MGYDSAWPLYVCLALLVAFAFCPFFRAADTPPGKPGHRVVTLDGMRGFLALAVVFHHAAVYRRYLIDGVWEQPASHFYRILGPVGVACFFMITGFLFWTQLLRTKGRPSWIGLYTGRVFRIGPLYLAAVALMMLVVLARADFHLQAPAGSLLRQCVRWSSLGALPAWGFNGDRDANLLLAKVTWTLRWEWAFYCCLPPLSLFVRAIRSHLAIVLALIAACQAYLLLRPEGTFAPELSNVMLFLLGMLLGSLRHQNLLARLPDRFASTLMVVLLVLIFQFESPNQTAASQLLIAAFLYLAISGASLFGLLKTRAAIRLGNLSYGIYLLQGLALAAVFQMPAGSRLDRHSPLAHWGLTLLTTVLLVCAACIAHVWIELPGIRLGKRVSARLREQTTSTGAKKQLSSL